MLLLLKDEIKINRSRPAALIRLIAHLQASICSRKIILTESQK